MGSLKLLVISNHRDQELCGLGGPSPVNPWNSQQNQVSQALEVPAFYLFSRCIPGSSPLHRRFCSPQHKGYNQGVSPSWGMATCNVCRCPWYTISSAVTYQALLCCDSTADHAPLIICFQPLRHSPLSPYS